MKTAGASPTVDLRPLLAVLAENGLIGKNGKLDFAAYEPAFPRLPQDRSWHFRVSSHGEALFHLIVGAQLGPLHSRAADFFKACPTLACRPLRYGAYDDGLEYLCLEHFLGESLDQAVQTGQCTATQWLAAVRKAQRILARTAQPSTMADLKQEVQQLCDRVCALPGFSEADAVLLRDLAQPLLIAGCSSKDLSLRWSNGDFVGRNLLVNGSGEIRLIDYEFAARTHFGQGDWLRLMQFSTPPKALNPAAVREFAPSRQPWLQVYLWLHQLSHQHGAAPSPQQEQHVATAVSQLFKAVRNATPARLPGRKQSFLIDSLSGHQSQLELLLEQRTAWATSLDTALTKARAAHAEQAGLVAERTAWAQKLNAQLKAAAEENQRLRTRLAGGIASANAGSPKSPDIVGHRDILLHFHLFKNAGTALDAALEKNLGPAWMQVEGDDPNGGMDWREALKFIEDHPEARALSSHTLRFPPPPRLHGINFHPLILLRHPIDRLASIYHFERANAEGSHSETSRVAQSGSLAEFVNFILHKHPEIGCDTQTACIGRSGVYDGPPTAKHLEAAKSAIDALPVPGVIESLDQYLALLEMESSILPPNLDLACPDENRNRERAPALLARLRKVRASLPPELWRELCERNRLDLDLWRHAHRLAKARFVRTPGAAYRLADFRRRKALANEAALHGKEPAPPAKRGRRSANPVRSPHAVPDGSHRAYALLKETADARLAWAQVLEKELRSTQAEFEKLTKEFAERSAWANSLNAELQQARMAFAEESKRVDERTAWAKALDADLEKARGALAEQTKVVEERTVWAKKLEADLMQDRANFAQLTKEHQKRTVWAKKLEADLRQDRAAFAAQTKVAADRTIWAQELNLDLGKARAAHAEQVRQVAERTAWAEGLDAELQKARALLAAQSKLVEERTAWGTSLDAELSGARKKLAEQGKLAQESSVRAQALDAELQSTQRNYAKLCKEHAERTAWALALDADLQGARILLTEQSKLVEERTAWAQALDAELQKARGVAAEREQLAQQTLGALAVMRRDLVAKNVETKATAGSLLDAELRAEAAEAEVRRLSATQTDALTQVNHLLRHSQLLQHSIAGLEAVRQATQEEIRQQARELARYEARLLCRLAAKLPHSPALRLHP